MEWAAIAVIGGFVFIAISVWQGSKNKAGNTKLIAVLLPYYSYLSDEYKTALLKQLGQSARREFEYILQEAVLTEKDLSASHKRYQYLGEIARYLYLTITQYYAAMALRAYQTLSEHQQKEIYQQLSQTEAKQIAPYLTELIQSNQPVDEAFIQDKWLKLMPLVHGIIKTDIQTLQAFQSLSEHAALLNAQAKQYGHAYGSKTTHNDWSV